MLLQVVLHLPPGTDILQVMDILGKATTQRAAIAAVIEEQKRPMTLTDILEQGQRSVPSLNQATVYRNLKRMIAAGKLRKISHPELGILYEKTGTRHHHLFYCRVCSRSYEIPGCGLNQSESLPPGFTLEDHEVFLFGVCSACKH